MLTRTVNAFAAVAVASLSLFGGADQARAELKGEITIDGSSTVYPITEAVAEEFREVAPGVRVTVGISGTGGGFKRFVIGETDISDASRPIKDKEYKAAIENGIEFIEIPVAYDGLSIVVNKDNTWAKDITVEEIRKIYLEKHAARTWKDVRPEWPDIEIKVFGAGTDSGTYDYFHEVVGKKESIRPDMNTSEDDNVLVTGVAGNKGAIGFFGCAYYFENRDKLGVLAVVNKDGKAVKPSATTVEDGSYNPFSRPLFIYVNADSADRPEVDEFVQFYLDNAAELSDEVGYVRLPSSVYETARQRYENRVTGSCYWTADMKPIKGPVTKVYHAGE
ncbi:MAG: PstS family phosphate ABC transporter substrate-binding protein [Phycisphaeraceae bacterium]